MLFCVLYEFFVPPAHPRPPQSDTHANKVGQKPVKVWDTVRIHALEFVLDPAKASLAFRQLTYYKMNTTLKI